MAEQTPSQNLWLTRAAFDRLKEELDHLKTQGRQEVSARIGRAREEGDLSENSGYHAAKDEQGQMEARIQQLEYLLANAEVGEAPVNSDTVGVGSTVTIAYGGDLDDTETFLLGSREMLGVDADVETQVYSPQSPLGSALLGKGEGDQASYQAPNGKTINVQIVSLEAFQA